MPWIQLKIDTNADNAESIGEGLSDVGALAVTFLDAKDTPMYEPKPGEVMLWPDTKVIGLFEASVNVDEIVAALATNNHIQADTPWKADPLEDKDWEREWMDNFHPMQFGKRLWVCPSWRDVPNPDAVNVMLDPGLAFGTGTHPTTSLCLKWLDSQQMEGAQFVDFGCGSGILAVAALKLGAQQGIGIDIDPQALQASEENARRNDVDHKLKVYLPQHQPTVEADFVFANILSGPLLSLRETITSFCRVGGKLVLSGILAEQVSDIEKAYSQDFELEVSEIDGEWARVAGLRKQN